MSGDRTQRTALSTTDRADLEARHTRTTTQWRDRVRALIVLHLADGYGIRETARRVGVDPRTVRKWWGRYTRDGLQGLDDAPRSGPPPVFTAGAYQVLASLATSVPPYPYASWTRELLAKSMGEEGWPVSSSHVDRMLKKMRLDVTRVRGWLSRRDDPQFEVRMRAIVDLLENLPSDGLVYALDEKPGISVRTPLHPDVPAVPGRKRRREFEYLRQGTIPLMGVVDLRDGALLLVELPSTNSKDFTQFLTSLLPQDGTPVTLLMDNGSSHVSKHTQRWLAAHPHVRVVYTPVHTSWANPVESSFSVLARQVLKYGWFDSRDDLVAKALDWALLRLQTPHPVKFNWEPWSGSRTPGPEH